MHSTSQRERVRRSLIAPETTDTPTNHLPSAGPNTKRESPQKR
jgi:hypothetical protein